MAEKKSPTVQARPTRPPLIYRLVDLLFDHFLARARFLLFPFRLLTWLGSGLIRALWMLSNEYTKQKFKHCGRGVRIHGPFRLTAPQEFEVGDNVHINANAFLRAEGGLGIGANTHISRNLVVYTMNHNYRGQHLPYDAGRVLKPVRIGRNVWIGTNVTIVPGVTIGDGAIIGMGAVVAKDVPPLAVVGSASPQLLKMRDESHYHRLDEAGRYGGMSGYLWEDQADE